MFWNRDKKQPETHDRRPAAGDGDAKLHVPVDPEWEVHPEQVRRMLQEKVDFLFLDIRLDKEIQVARIHGATWVPLHELPASIQKLESWRNKHIVVHCHRGRRSLHATQWLREQGFTDAYSMAGGIDAWSILIDNAVPQY